MTSTHPVIHSCRYSPKAHPEFSREQHELVVSFASNAVELKTLEEDVALYYPILLRITFNLNE